MKKIIILVVGLFLVTASNLLAQETQNVSVTADVLTVLDYTVNSNVEFGNVQTGAVAEVQANGNDTADSNASAPLNGDIDITAGGQNYIITVTQDAILENAAADQLTFTHRIFIGASNITLAVDGAGHTVSGGLGVKLEIGGQLQSPTVAGTYSTLTGAGQPLTLSVAYDI